MLIHFPLPQSGRGIPPPRLSAEALRMLADIARCRVCPACGSRHTRELGAVEVLDRCGDCGHQWDGATDVQQA